jgi:hypothetical protein
MPRPGDTIHIPLKTNEAISGLLAVKPTADMPRRPKAEKPKQKSAKKRR